jgi:hypothetical protein
MARRNVIVRPLTEDVRARMPRRATESSPFRSSWSQTEMLLMHELAAIRSREAVLMLDITSADLRADGGIRSTAKPVSPGAALSIVSATKGNLLFVCGRFRSWQDNIRAIALGLEALRKIDRYGIVSTDEQYRGWQALGPGAEDEPWVIVLMAHSGWTAAAVKADPDEAYRQAVKATHPDAGGDPADFRAVKRAHDQSRSLR